MILRYRYLLSGITVTSEKIVTNQITQFLKLADNRVIWLVFADVTLMTLSNYLYRIIIFDIIKIFDWIFDHQIWFSLKGDHQKDIPIICDLGYVPGRKFKSGQTFYQETINAKEIGIKNRNWFLLITLHFK